MEMICKMILLIIFLMVQNINAILIHIHMNFHIMMELEITFQVVYSNVFVVYFYLVKDLLNKNQLFQSQATLS